MDGSADSSHLLRRSRNEKSLWSDIPPEIFSLTLKRLSFTDILKCKPVCASWRKMATARTIDLSVKLEDPLLTVPDGPLLSLVTGEGTEESSYPRDGYMCLYSFTKEKFIEFDKVPAGMSCLGSSQGWLIFGNTKTLYAFNPFLDVGFRPIPSAVCVPREYLVYKAIMWGDPILNKNDYGVVLMVECVVRTGLFYATCRDHVFTELKDSKACYYDVTCYNNRIYGLTSSGSVEAWDWNSASPEKVLDIKISFPQEVVEKCRDRGSWSPTETLYSRKFYLVVDSMGEILLAKGYVGEYFDENQNVCTERSEGRVRNAPCLTMLFLVYKLDIDSENWVELDSLGERILFVGGNQSASLLSKDFPGYEKNSIYFTADKNLFLRFRLGHDMGVFNLADGGIRHFYTGDGTNMNFHEVFWVVRDLKKGYQLNP